LVRSQLVGCEGAKRCNNASSIQERTVSLNGGVSMLPRLLSEPAGAVELEGGLVSRLEVIHAAQGGARCGDGDESALARQVF
jgi:hypothetical protein